MAGKQMKLATEEQVEPFFETAKNWLESTNAKVVFASDKYIAFTAVAEYLANQEGLTLYKGSMTC